MPDAPADAYDVVVIGSGIERSGSARARGEEGARRRAGGQPGGYAHSFKRGPYTFDPAISVFPQGHDDALPVAVLDYLGVRDRCRFLPAESNYRAVFPDFEITTPFGIDEFVDVHCERFPGGADGLREFFHLCRKLHKEAHELPLKVGLAGLDEAVRRFPVLFKYIKSTTQEGLDDYLDDPVLKSVASVAWPYLGLPPSRLDFVHVLDGAERLPGRVLLPGGRLPVARRRARRGHGAGRGRARPRAARDPDRGRRRTRAGGRARGRGPHRSDQVVSNADARATFVDMLGSDHLPAPFVKRVGRMTPSVSAVVVFIATSST